MHCDGKPHDAPPVLRHVPLPAAIEDPAAPTGRADGRFTRPGTPTGRGSRGSIRALRDGTVSAQRQGWPGGGSGEGRKGAQGIGERAHWADVSNTAPFLHLPQSHRLLPDEWRAPQAVGTSSFSTEHAAAMVIDGRNDTSWLSAVQQYTWAAQELEVDLHGGFHVQQVSVAWASSGVRPADLVPGNFTVSLSLTRATWTDLAPAASGQDEHVAVMVPGPSAGALESRYVRLRVWNYRSAQLRFYGVTSLQVTGADASLQVSTSADASWLLAGASATITWPPLPGIGGMRLELLNSLDDRTPHVIAADADQPSGTYQWAIPKLTGALGHSQPVGGASSRPSDTVLVGSNYFLRASRPQGMAGRRVVATVGPLAVAGNMAEGGHAGATSQDSLATAPVNAFDGILGSLWSNDCRMGIGGSSGGQVGEVLQIFLPEPTWMHSLRLVWPGPRMPSAYTIWHLPLRSSERTGAGVAGVPNPMVDLSMSAGYMRGWVKIAEFVAGDASGDPTLGRTDHVMLTSWPLQTDVLRLQIPFDWLASCFPLAEWEVMGVPLVSVAQPVDRAVVPAGLPYALAWATPPGAAALASIVDGSTLTMRFATLINAQQAGWVPSNVSGWGNCFGQAFADSSGVVVAGAPVTTGVYNWSVPCSPGAAKYYLTLEFSVSDNPVTVYSEFFAISREPQRPRNLVLSAIQARTATVVWLPGYDNGAEIVGYRIELREWQTSSKIDQHTTGNFTFTSWSSATLDKSGTDPNFKLKDLIPFTNYSVRLSAINAIGRGMWSDLLQFRTNPDVPDSATQLTPSVIRSNDINMTWVTPFHNGDLVNHYIVNLQTTAGDVLQSHKVSVVKCRDPNAENATIRRICPLADQKGYQDCSGLQAPDHGTMGTCSSDGWLRHGSSCFLRCLPGFDLSGKQPECSYGALSVSIRCTLKVSGTGGAQDTQATPLCTHTADAPETAAVNEEACSATDAAACSSVALSRVACVTAAAGKCTYTPDNVNTTINEESCVAIADESCRGSALDGNSTTCTGVGDCTYMVAAAANGANASGLVNGTCIATAADACAAVILGVNATTCTTAGQCTYVADVDGTIANEEVCVASGQSLCTSVTLDGKPETCTNVKLAPVQLQNAAADDLQLTGDISKCPGRSVFQNPPGECPYRDCLAGEIRDCNGICLSAHACTHIGWGITSCSGWGNRLKEGDGFCANGIELSSTGYRPNFNCPHHNCEGTDCRLDPLGGGTPCGPDFDQSLLVDPNADLTASCDETPPPFINVTFDKGEIHDSAFVYNTTYMNGLACRRAGFCIYTLEIEATELREEACTASGVHLCEASNLSATDPKTECESNTMTGDALYTGLDTPCTYTPDDPATTIAEDACNATHVRACAAVSVGVPDNTAVYGNPVVNSSGVRFDGVQDVVIISMSQWGQSGQVRTPLYPV